jgi:hypothetical protein
MNKGFSLMSVLIAGALVGGPTVTVMKTMELSGRSSTTTTQNAEINELSNEIKDLLSDQQSCADSLVGKKPSSTTSGINFLVKNYSDGPRNKFPIDSELGTRKV